MKHIFTTVVLLIGALTAFSQGSKVRILSGDIDVKITKLNQLNSSSEETNISITPSGKVMYFMSDRGGQSWSQVYGMRKGTVRYDGDIWYSIKQGDTWSAPKCLGSSVNSSKGEDEPNVAPDGRIVSFQSWMDGWEKNGGPYYNSRLSGTFWSPPKGLGGGITAFFKREYEKYGGYGTDGMSISPDGKRFIVACGKDYYGNLDLYMSVKGSNGVWGTMKKLPISTSGDERSVFWGADSKTLYFSSNGYAQGFGGKDIYKTVINDNGSNGEIINLGERFNTAANDYGFIIAASGEEAYFVRNGDIYQAKIIDPPADLLPTATALVQGTVTKEEDGKAVKMLLKLIETGSGKVVETTYSNAIDGHYSFYVSDARKNYKVVLYKGKDVLEETPLKFNDKQAYQELEVNFKVKEKKEEPKEIVKNDPPKEDPPKEDPVKKDTVKVEPPKEKVAEVPEEDDSDEIVIVNYHVFQYIHFSYEQTALPSKAKFKLLQTVRYMKENPKAKFLVTGYDDSRGTKPVERKIAKDRALAVASFLISGGVAQDRLVLEYYTHVYHQQKYDKYPYPAIRLTELSLLSKNKMDLTSHNLINLDMEEIADAGLGGFGLFNELAVEKNAIDKQIEIFNDFKNGYEDRGIVNYLMGDYKSAESDFSRAIALNTAEGVMDPETYYYRAMTRFELRNYNAAREDLNLALAEEPAYVDALMARATVLTQMGEDEMAREDWRRADAIQPGIATPFLKQKQASQPKIIPASFAQPASTPN